MKASFFSIGTYAKSDTMMGAGWPADDLVFAHPDGSGLWPQTITRRFKEIAIELGLPTIGVHGLRHTSATWMISQGISPNVVAKRLGHAHVSITLGLYTHVLPNHDRDAVDAFGSALAAAQNAACTIVRAVPGDAQR